MIFDIVALRLAFVALAILNVIIDIKAIKKMNFEDSLKESAKVRSLYLKSGKSVLPYVAVVSMVSVFYYIIGFSFVSLYSFMPIPLMNYKVIGFVLLSKILNLMMNHFCVEGIMNYDKSVFHNDLITRFVSMICSLLIGGLIIYQTVMKFLS